MEYWIRDHPRTSIPPLPSLPACVFLPLIVVVVSISPMRPEYIIGRTCGAAYPGAYGSAFADVGMRRCADSRPRRAAECRAR